MNLFSNCVISSIDEICLMLYKNIRWKIFTEDNSRLFNELFILNFVNTCCPMNSEKAKISSWALVLQTCSYKHLRMIAKHSQGYYDMSWGSTLYYIISNIFSGYFIDNSFHPNTFSNAANKCKDLIIHMANYKRRRKLK